jgi:hypothetical protein
MLAVDNEVGRPLAFQGVPMTISSDLPSPSLLKAALASPPAEAAESKAVPEHDGDADDATTKASLKSYQGTKVNTSA